MLFFATSSFIAPLTAAKIANAVLYVIAIGAVAYSAELIFPSKSRLAAKITALLLAFWPNHVAYTTLTSVEIYFVFLTTCGIALMLAQQARQRIGFAAAAGLCCGLAILTKPQAVFLPAAIMLAIYFRNYKQAMRPLVVLYAVALLCVLPWSFRNYRAFDGRFVFVSNNGGINLLVSNMPGSWGYSGLMWNKELDAIITTTKDEVQRDQQAKDVALDYAVHNIGPLLKMVPAKLIGLYASDVDGFGWNQSAVAGYGNAPIWMPLRIVSEGYYLAVAVLALGCFWRNRRGPPPSYWAGPMLMLYFTGICLVFTGGPRFHFPMVPWFAVYAAGLLAAWLEPGQLPPAAPPR